MTKILIKTIKELKKWQLSLDLNINFVPTMGNLHKGHSKLIKEAQKYDDNFTLVSIFINPLQFDKQEDLHNYPKTINHDIDIAFSSGADGIFIPDANEIYPKENSQVDFLEASKNLSNTLCGLYREGHFNGVCTVIYRFLNLIKPKTLFLGEKDWQQLLIIKKLIQDKNLNITIKSIDTQRDSDGVPYSSRNNFLSIDERKKLIIFSRELSNAKRDFQKHQELNLSHIMNKLKDNDIQLQYLEHLNAFNFKRSTSEDNITILAGAILCRNARLIDHVFLMKRNPTIAIDGPAGSGKSTITKLIARKLNFLYLDTGAMYRALSWFLINQKINYENFPELSTCLENISIIFKSGSNSEQDVYINNICVTDKIRSPEISSIVSSIASIKEVRKFLVDEQRKIGKEGGIVAEGRDIGTKVFPNAEVKIFLNASIDERAKRRKLELEKRGYGNIDLNKIKEGIKQRDFEDSNRKISPLTKAQDATEVITDGYGIDQIVDQVINIYFEKIPKELQI